MNDYILVVSTEKPDPWSANLSDSQRISQEHIAALKRLSTGLSTLHRESLPDIPHSLDVAKCLASMSSAVIRSASKSQGPAEVVKTKTTSGSGSSTSLAQFAAECWALERDVTSAIARVEQAEEDVPSTRPYQHSRANSASSVTGQFQPFALEPRSSPSTPIATSPSPPGLLKHSRGYSELQYTPRGMKDIRAQSSQEVAGASSIAVTHDATPQARPAAHRADSDPVSQVVTSLLPSAPKPADERRRLVKSPSRPEFNAQGVPVKKRSGFFSWSGRKDES